MVPGQELDLEEAAPVGPSGKEGCVPVSHSALGQDSVGESQGRGPSPARKTLPIWRCEALGQEQSRVRSVPLQGAALEVTLGAPGDLQPSPWQELCQAAGKTKWDPCPQGASI